MGCGPVGSNLPVLLHGRWIASLVDRSFGGRRDNPSWATSHLAVKGTYVHPEPTADDWQDVMIAKAAWGCRYSPGQAADDDRDTAWCEGVDGPGIGQVLLVPIGKAAAAEIWNGYQKSEHLRTGNARPRRVRVTLLDVRGTSWDHTQMSDIATLGPIAVLGSDEATLKDVAGPQPLPLPAAERPPGDRALVGLEILSVYAGERYADTCVGDVVPVASE